MTADIESVTEHAAAREGALGIGGAEMTRVLTASAPSGRIRDTTFDVAFDRVPTPFALVGLDGGFLRVNQAFARLLGRPTDELMAMMWPEVVHPNDLDTCAAFMGAALAGGEPQANLEVRFLTASDDIVWTVLGAALIRDELGEPIGFVGHLQDVTDRVRAQAAVIDSEQQRRMFFERIPVALYRTSPDGEIIDANEALAELLGYPDVEALKGLNAADAYVSEGERIAVAHRMEADGVILGYEAELRRLDGSTIWVRDTAKVVADDTGTYYEGALVDVTDRKRAELALVRKARQQEALADLGRLALEVTDLDLVYDAAVAALTDVLEADDADLLILQPDGGFAIGGTTTGLERGRVIAHRDAGTLAGYTLDSEDAVIVTDLQKERRFVVPEAQLARGFLSAASLRIRGSRGSYGVLGTFSCRAGAFAQDAAPFLTSVANVVAAAIERSRARRRLEELVRSKDEFVASVSHEVRTPLTVVSGLADELSDRWRRLEDEEVDEFLGLIVEHSRDMGYLIEDLLVAARADIGKVPIHTTRVNLAEEVSQALAGITVDAGTSVEVDEASVQAVADPARVRQIVRNLLTNAFRYGGDRIRVVFETRGSEVAVTVHDNGEGIPDEYLERVFEPYERSHLDAGQPSSVGLGLTVSRKLARLMGGELTAHRSDGMAFTVTFPAA